MDYKNPDYTEEFQRRLHNLQAIRANPQTLPALRMHYAGNPIDFINDWGVTLDPRNIAKGVPAFVPFVLMPKQEDLVHWIEERWRMHENGLVEKSRDCGASWTAIAWSVTRCLFTEGFQVGFGSRKEQYVDSNADPKSLFFKARAFIEALPYEFRGDFDKRKHAPHMRVQPAQNGSVLTGEAGDNIGRGDRTSAYFVDESAHLERPLLADAALSGTTDCRIDMSSVNGVGNPFHQKRFSYEARKIFIFDWRDDPRKDKAWYDRKLAEVGPLIMAQEYDRNYSASAEGVLIPSAYVQAAIGAFAKLGIRPSGEKRGALDVADKGVDLNAFTVRNGQSLTFLQSWSGKTDTTDIFATVEKTFHLCDLHGLKKFRYDGDGLGAGVRGDARVINEKPERAKSQKIVEVFQGSSTDIVNPDQEVVHGDNGSSGRTNKDFFYNVKAQGWWHLSRLFINTYRYVVEGVPCDPQDMIDIDPVLPELSKLTTELSQVTYSLKGSKVIVNKAPDGMASPNLADSVMINYAPIKTHRGLFG